MVWFGFAVMLILTAACVWGVIWAAEPTYFSVYASDFIHRRRNRTLLWIFRMMPEPMRVLVMLSALAMFATCSAAVARLLWRNPPLAEFRSDGIVTNHLFKRRFDLWHKIRLINYCPKYDKQGFVSHRFHITLPRYGFSLWPTHEIDIASFRAKFNAQQLLEVLHEKRPDLLPDLFLASDRKAEVPLVSQAPPKPVAPAIVIKSGSWTG
jgi:hypothetical protein